MKYIFITFEGLGYPIAYRLQQEGHEVVVGLIDNISDYVLEDEAANAHEEPDEKKMRHEMYCGMLDIQSADRVVAWMKTVKNPHKYFVCFDVNNLYRWADKVRDLGFEGNFPTKEDFLLEVNREDAIVSPK